MNRIVSVAGREIGPGRPCFIIAEVGINHMGRVDLAWDMIRAAWDAGADAVKIQSFDTDKFLHPSHPGYKLDKDCQLAREEEARLWEMARQEGILLFSTPEDAGSLEFIRSQKPPLAKVAAMDFDCRDHVQAVAGLGVPVILSAGMSDLTEVLRALAWVEEVGNPEVVLLHCVSLYPAPASAMNLRVIPTLAGILDCPVGFSDHSRGLHLPLAAVALGAKVVEKHFSLDKSLPGPDQACSMDPADLAEFKRQVRELEEALGHGRKVPAPEEAAPRRFKRRGVYAARNLAAGERVTRADVDFKAPSLENSTMALWPRIQGSALVRDVAENTPIGLEDII